VIDFTLSQLLMRACAVLLVSTLQGWAMAMAAGALGDAGPEHDGRLTIDPLRHVDMLGGAVALIFSIGWARWMAVDPRALRHGRFDLLLVVGAGFAAIVLGVLGLRFVRPLLLPLLHSRSFKQSSSSDCGSRSSDCCRCRRSRAGTS
jgi:Zn-dependent protease